VSEEDLFPWIAVNTYMDDEYREALAEIALRHLPEASSGLVRFARKATSRITVPGFRSVDRAPVERAREPVVEEMLLDNDVATAVVCLWAEAEEDTVEELRSAAESEGLRFRSPWTWEEGRYGFYSFEQIAPLGDIAYDVAQDESSLEADHLQLASLWLSGSLRAEPEPIEEARESSAPGEDERVVPKEGEERTSAEEKQAARDEEEQPLPPETDESSDVQEVVVYEDSLGNLRRELAELSQEFEQGQQNALAAVRGVLSAVQQSKPQLALEQSRALRDQMSAWETQAQPLWKTVRQALPRLSDEAEVRPDLQLQLAGDGAVSEELVDKQPLSDVVESIFDDLQRLDEYDEERQDILAQVDEVGAAIVGIHADISHWMPDEPLTDQDIPRWEDESKLTLTEAKQLLETAEAKKKEFEDRQAQLRQLSQNRIMSQIERLQELGFPSERPVWSDQTLAEILSQDLEQFSSGDLRDLEQTLVDQVEEQTLAVRSTAPKELAEELQSEWDEETLIELLESLAEDRRDVEALLLLVSASATHPPSEPISLERSEVSSILRGIGALSKKPYPFRLLGGLAPDLVNGWRAVEPRSLAELYIVFLAARYSGDDLPEGFLWQLTDGEWEWPVPEMRLWNRVWHAALQGNQLPIVDEAQENMFEERLEEARSEAERMLTREAGRYVCLNSIKSGRHAGMLRKHVMPGLREQLDELESLEERWRESGAERRQSLLEHLQGLLNGDLARSLDEESLEEQYEMAALEEGIQDSVPFHRKVALRTLDDCASSILDYARTLAQFWKTQAAYEERLTRKALEAELDSLPDLTPLGQAALDRIAQGARSGPQVTEVGPAASAEHQLIEELLGKATFASRVPHVVGHLTTAPLRWSELLEPILDDVAAGLDPESAAHLLLDHEAPTQALLLTKHLSLDTQKQAQTLERKKRQEVEEIYESLLRLGGEAQDLLVHQDLGRWELVSREMMQQLEEARERHEAQREEREGKALDLRQAINELDNRLFKARGSIPVDVQRVIEEGLNLARRATAQEKWFDSVRDYLDEIRYRMERESWPLDKLQEAHRRLEDSMAVGGQEKIAAGAEEVLSLFERGELEQLGLRPLDLPPSRIRTRTRLLHHWLDVASLPAFRSESLGPSERASIKNLFSDFAQMIVMDRVEAPTSTAFEEPVVYSYWKLRYHKVDALKRNCIFIALPGDPPSGKDLSELDHILEEKEWLDYWYVFLFVPGGTPAQLNRLRSTYRGDRLVIVDEPALLDMVLAEVEGSKPLWRLRPLMLRAWGAEKADIFLVNESISLRTGIFVGRGDLVQRIASSGSDYALYGGRRIGKSSVLKEVERHLQRGQEVQVLAASFEGDRDLSDDAVARKIARRLQLDSDVREVGDLKGALQARLDSQPKSQLVLLLDEIDRYIEENPERHVFIEALRALSEQYGSRFRVVIAGFMGLYDCLHSRGPYSPASDPWGRMLDDLGPLPNLRPENAEEIVEEGFAGILGWDFEIPVIPQRIVRHTGGHPSFVQYFCRRLQVLVGQRRDRTVRLSDIEAVFNDMEADSFIDHVSSTLRLNLDEVGEFLIPWLALMFGDAQSFTVDQMRDLADSSTVEIPDELLSRSLERLAVTKVVEKRTPQVYEFSVPDYPLILNRLGETAEPERAERKLQAYLDKRQ
jgi:hypothetical protein